MRFNFTTETRFDELFGRPCDKPEQVSVFGLLLKPFELAE